MRTTVGAKLAFVLMILALTATACRSGANQAAPGDEGDAEQTSGAATEADTDATEDTGATEGGAGGEIATDVGVTEEPCPNAVNQDHGCIYLGTLSDLTEGPFASLGQSIVAAQQAFWNRVNEEGGIGGQYDVDVETYVRDNKYNPQVTTQVYQDIKPNILGIAQTLGSPPTAAILDDLKSSTVVSVPATWSSLWEFEDVIIESGTNYCFEAANAIDYAVDELGAQSVMAVHYPGEYGEDGAAGAQIAAEARGLEFTDVETPVGAENQAGAVAQIVQSNPDVVFVTTGPTDLATILGQAAAQGYQGRFIGQGPTWNPALLQSPAAEAIKAQYLQTGPWETFTSEGPGYDAMREALGEVQPNDGYTSGWIWSYPMRAALEAAVENGDLTRQGLLDAVNSLEDVDYEGMLPEGAGNFAGEPNDTVFRQSVLSQPDDSSPTGLSTIEEFYVGPTSEGYDFTGPCFEAVG
jgi:ABC-type branched-subunit amino acid transport system substrate-binding protein